ncbi:unnamed protein product [Acanthoscelides obtectus]|uniref:Uncharacterized protein n=1 Tax=Acanthoscelides obtectus TaxID=200917 RepID=A0A9P0K7J9_ACAOB|nr:unnamed protein product [Acanthoscelides obtectus]CAK1648301.1 hypothetical protein AOBTE_LOCUS15663 [Acanthoscelides obtectus]
MVTKHYYSLLITPYLAMNKKTVVLAAIIALLSLIDKFQRQWDVGSAFFVELAVKKLRQPSTVSTFIKEDEAALDVEVHRKHN